MLGKTSQCGCSFGLLWLREIGKGNGKGFGKERGINWHFIYENNGNYEKRKVTGHMLHVRRKRNQNNGKSKKLKASLLKMFLRISWKDFFSHLWLSHYSLSLSLSLLNTLIFLWALWHWIKKGKGGRREEGASKEEQDQVATARFFVGTDLHVWFPC